MSHILLEILCYKTNLQTLARFKYVYWHWNRFTQGSKRHTSDVRISCVI